MTELVPISNTALYRPGPTSAAPIMTGEMLHDKFMKFVDRRPSTMKGYDTCLRQFFGWMLDTGRQFPLTNDDIIAYRDYLTGATFGRSGTERLKPGTQQQYLRAVKQFFKWAASEKLHDNVAESVHGAKVSANTHRKDPLQREDVKIVADSIDRSTEQGKRLYAMYLLCISCGLRTIEINRANIEDIKTVGKRTYLYLQGKGHDERDQPVLLIPEVMEAIQDYLNSRSDHRAVKGPLFVSTSNKGKPGARLYKTETDPITGHKEKVLDRISDGRIAPTTISTMLKGALVHAGYDSDRLTAHSLRHTSGTGAYKATGNIYLAQKHQRHVDPATTEIYVHAEDRQERETEKQVYDYYFHPDAVQDERSEAITILNGLNPAKLHQVCEFLRAIK